MDPCCDDVPQLGFIPRISRLWNRAAGDNWALMPSTAGVVDPLHSTGIAHSLFGVLRLATLLGQNNPRSASEQRRYRQTYSTDVVAEVKWIDRLVHCCYESARRSFELFTAACSLYFVSAIHSERQLSEQGELPDGFLLHRNELLQRTVAWFQHALSQGEISDASMIDSLRETLKPLNDVGLLDPSLNNRFTRSVAPK